VTLVRLAGEIARSVAAVGRVAIDGEVHRPMQSRGGRIFFTLRDRAAEMKVAVPASAVRRCRAVHGERVCVVGALEWVNDRGSLQIRAEEVSPVGTGAIAAMIAEARRRLVDDGLVDRPRRVVPRLPRRIGVICGADAAVRKDIESVVAERFAGYPLVVRECAVSGPGAPSAIVETLHEIASQPGVDVVIMARGGGDATALLAWSDEDVCRAVAACPVPVVSAIGHDGDHPLCDEVADVRCGTPSIAAATIVPSRAELHAGVDRLLAASTGRMAARCERSAQRLSAVDTAGALTAGVRRAADLLSSAGRELARAHPRRQLAAAGQRLANLDWRRPAGERVGYARGRLEAEGRHLRALSPQHVLERGYAVVRRAEDEVVRRWSQVSPDEDVAIRLAEGRLVATVRERHSD
jgi:exodeoxyribonuclease VII large subunit